MNDLTSKTIRAEMQSGDYYRCIYCCEAKPKTEFNKEHVLQESFGKFQMALTLTKEVCKKCNDYFSKGLDRILGRDSIEALYRLRSGIKPPDQADDILYDRITLTLPKDGCGEWGGMRLEYAPDSHHRLTVRTLTQVGFWNRATSEYIYFTLQELENRQHLNYPDLDIKAEIKIRAKTKEDGERLRALLSQNGLSVDSSRDIMPLETVDGRVQVSVRFVIDRLLARAIAKVGFNYMAKVCGPELALRDDFNPIRQFIRYDLQPPGWLNETIEPSHKPLLADDSRTARRYAHILAIEWDITKRHILAKVSVFNSVVWTIMLARSFSGLYREIKSCHCYDIQNRVVRQLPVISRELVP